MTVKKTARTGGFAAIVARQKLHSTNQQLDILSISKTSAHQNYNIVVGFNEKDQLQLLTKEDISDEDKKLIKDYTELKTTKCENVSIDEISNCVNIENYPNCENTLVFHITKNVNREAIALKFENEQDFKRIYFTYKYFKMRNRLTKNSSNYSSSESLFSKKKTYDIFNNRKNSMDDYSLYDKGRTEYDLMQTVDNDGVTHISVQQKNLNTRFDQPLSLIGIRNDINDIGEIDSIIYTDIEIPIKSDRKRLFHKKSKAPLPPALKDNQPKVLKGEFVRVNVDRVPDIIPKENKLNKVPDILMFRENNKSKKNATGNVWPCSNKVTGYESDCEEWKSSRSQFSTTAFDSLARPTKMAMALTLRKPQRLEPVPQYYRLSSEQKPKLTPMPFRPSNFIQRPPRLPRPNTDMKRNMLNTDHRKFTSLQSLEMPKKLCEQKKPVDPKKNYSNISHRITGLTNKLRDLGNPSNTIGRFKAQSHGDVANLKPVLKTGQDGAKRSVVRTCSAEPPKKVTFSAFATVQCCENHRYEVTMSLVAQAFQSSKIVPDVIPTAPTVNIQLKYPSGAIASQGNELTPTQVKDQPSVSFEADPNSYYTLIFTDPDNYDGPEQVYREWHHWLVVNIPGGDVSKGDVLSGYIGSGPPQGTGIHRYVYIVYKQPGKLNFNESVLDNKSINGRAAFSTKKFAEKYNLGAPVAGNFYRAQFDDYVPLLYKSLGA
ncbi:unnamed protein product [Arctia plantaginis]|uniref:Uncharacterized protein n=1 Tax=Arctia plantaginis TaxID=874455 RepID=A0A8S0YLF5_ARCPL|nr:unnamed protein product [Arctia plantaginis]